MFFYHSFFLQLSTNFIPASCFLITQACYLRALEAFFVSLPKYSIHKRLSPISNKTWKSSWPVYFDLLETLWDCPKALVRVQLCSELFQPVCSSAEQEDRWGCSRQDEIQPTKDNSFHSGDLGRTYYYKDQLHSCWRFWYSDLTARFGKCSDTNQAAWFQVFG